MQKLLGFIVWILLFTSCGYEQDCGVKDDKIEPGTIKVRSKCGEGQKLFAAQCSACHFKNLEDDATGPALKGVVERWEATEDWQGISGREWLARFIQNWQEVVDTGHPYANEIILWSPTSKTIYPNLAEEEILSIICFLEEGPQIKSMQVMP